eukprot:458357_1
MNGIFEMKHFGASQRCKRCQSLPKHVLSDRHIRRVSEGEAANVRFSIGSVCLPPEMFYLCDSGYPTQAHDVASGIHGSGRARRAARERLTETSHAWTVHRPGVKYSTMTPEWHRSIIGRVARISADYIPGLRHSIFQTLQTSPYVWVVACWLLGPPSPVTGRREAQVVGGALCIMRPDRRFVQILTLAIDLKFQGKGLGRRTSHFVHLMAYANPRIFISVVESCRSKVGFWIGPERYIAVRTQILLPEKHWVRRRLTHPSRYLKGVQRSKNSVLCSFPLRSDRRPSLFEIDPQQVSCGPKAKQVDKLSASLWSSLSPHSDEYSHTCRKRGRPRKGLQPVTHGDLLTEPGPQAVKKKRGRPRKALQPVGQLNGQGRPAKRKKPAREGRKRKRMKIEKIEVKSMSYVNAYYASTNCGIHRLVRFKLSD